MQKFILTLLLVAGLAGAANAQRSIRQRSMGASGTTSFGVKAGVTSSDLVGNNATTAKSIYGFHAGVFTNITLAPHLNFQPELLYSQKGASVVNAYTGNYATHRFHYADIPLAFRLNAGGFFLEAGPQIGFLLLGREEYEGQPSTSLNSDNYKTTDIGYLAGLGYERKSGFGFGARYNGEFTNVYQSVALGPVTLQQRARNSVFQLYLSYAFNSEY